MITYTINGIEYLHIQQFVDVIGRSQMSTRRLMDAGNSIRRLKYLRDGARVMIPIKELVGFPFVNQGKQLTGKDTYHYVPYQLQDDGTFKKFEGSVSEALKLTDLDNTDSDIVWRREFCEECTYTTKHCKARQEADND